MKFYFIFRYFYIKMLDNYNTHLVQTVYDYYYITLVCLQGQHVYHSQNKR